ncbi:MAG: dTDP-4-dehydrorhamnose reductase [Xanthomonadaceae bacterium]|nr:dTDP-4-dehydrorhamnose reductase [Xanthomonadaceae bacterium]
MRILLFGGNGQLGTELRRNLATAGDVTVTTRSGLLNDGHPCKSADLDAPESLEELILAMRPDIVVNAAAYTAVDRAEDDAAAAYRVNADAPQAMARACERSGATFVHYSTDYVFDGRANRPYRENDPVAPLGVYGASKLAGENAVRASGARYLIFRTAWVYAAHGANFLRTMLRLAAERDELRVVVDQFGSPTPASLIAEVTTRVLATHPVESGLWNLTTSGETSWHGFASAIVDGAHARGLLTSKPLITPILSVDYPASATRPHRSTLDNSRLRHGFGLTLPPWDDALGKVLDQLASAGVR